MAQSDYVFESGESITVGVHGQTEYIFSSNNPVTNQGVSNFVFESDFGWGGSTSEYGFGYGVGSGAAAGNVGIGYFDNARIVDGPIIDSAEDNNLSEYGYDTGGTWTVESGPKTPRDGSYYIKGKGDTSTSTHKLISYSGLDRYPRPGDTFRVAFNTGGNQPDEKQGPSIYYRGKESDNSSIRVGTTNSDAINPDSDEYRIFQHGSQNLNIGQNIQLDTWYEFEVDWLADDTGATARLLKMDGTVLGEISITF